MIEGHKLNYHPDRVADFLTGRTIWPIYAEVSPTSFCNHRCLFCNFNYLGHSGERLPDGRLLLLMDEFAQAGIKAVVFAGAGEPSLHPDTFPAVRQARERGIDVAMSTNGANLRGEQIEAMTELLTWARFSINGGTPESYAVTQGANPGDLAKALAAVSALADHKAKIGSAITIGSQCVLMPENKDGIVDLARDLKRRGVDYFSVKHYYPHEQNPYQPNMSFRSREIITQLRQAAAELSDGNFHFIVRDEDALNRQRPYAVCPGLPFIVYVREDGGLYTCFSHQDDPETAIGNVLDTDFVSLWQSPGKDRAMAKLASYDKNLCQSNCRHHQINLWLHNLMNPPMHINFI